MMLLLVYLPTFVPVVSAFSGAGSGTAEDPYQITTADELNETNDDLDAYYILMNDIDLNDYGVQNWNGGEGFIPICTDGVTPFTGNFNGQNHTISNLYVNSVADYQGLFGYIDSGGVVKNLGLINVDIMGANVGGLIGFIGYDGSTVTNCYSMGTVTGTNSDGFVGGLIGGIANGIISDCYSTGNTTGTGTVGGLIGLFNIGTVTNCYSTGNVTDTFTDIGGLFGYYAGGLIGYNGGTVIDCYSMEDIISSNWVGGLIGDSSGTITNCYSTGFVTGTSVVGGLVGLNEGGTVTNSYWDNETSNQTISDGGEGRTTAQMT